jgi:hypothetical protein
MQSLQKLQRILPRPVRLAEFPHSVPWPHEASKKTKGQPVSSPIGPLFMCRGLGLSGPARVCSVNANCKAKNAREVYLSLRVSARLLRCRCRTRPSQRATGEYFDRVRSALDHRNQRMAACGHALDGKHPTPVQQISTGHDRADHRENRREEGKCRQQFPNEVELHGSDDCQEPPHPLSAFVCLFHGVFHSGPRSQLLYYWNPFLCPALTRFGCGSSFRGLG